ncbi:MAG TPA: phosphatidylserine decarboxylase family protein [Solirubrobacteraceae bacterium]|nr:phosphatidylserine decarboxylase family protein [Solirubrobacteraceae bacterium]
MSEGDEHAARVGASMRQRVGGWLPPDQGALERWLAGLRSSVEEQTEPADLHPVMVEFQGLIGTDPVVRMYVEQMIAEVPKGKSYRRRHLSSVDQMLALINEVLTRAPEYNTTALVGAPLNAVIDWAMGTPAGFAAFRTEAINAMFKKILDVWCKFLSGPNSRYVLNDGPTGWKSPAAAAAIGIDQYRYDPDDEYWGFSSWNDFFTRRFKDGERPVADPDDDTVIVSACESTPFAIRTDAKRHDRFWLKSQPYSLQDMLANDDAVDQFVGGTVYQAFLSALNYHRWHSPVSGTIVRAFVKGGTYYSEADVEGEDPAGPNNSQGYLTHLATRALFFIAADDRRIGLMCFMPVGMAEVSSCVIDPGIAPGSHVIKGQELGYFQYGGSTHCLIFRPGVISDFAVGAIPQPTNPHAPLVRVGSRIATVA